MPRRGKTARRDRSHLKPPPELRQLGIAARKSLGQHFLVDQEIQLRIALAAQLSQTRTVIEIGPGLGHLTEALLERGATVAAVELDTTLCDYLRQRFAGRDAHVVNADALEAPPHELLRRAGLSPPFGAVGNLPYYITGLLLRNFLKAEPRPLYMVFMVQKEVAESIVSRPPRMTLLGVSVQFYAEAELMLTVPPEAFYPPPDVHSAVVRIVTRPRPAVPVARAESFFKLVRAGFSAPRKQLHNALSRALWPEPGRAADLLSEAGIEPTRRAQTMDIEDWSRLLGAWDRSSRGTA
jgi:16S rRNA (adenine1518-N6/adenine1519-N6)-dimethyltransferase